MTATRNNRSIIPASSFFFDDLTVFPLSGPTIEQRRDFQELSEDERSLPAYRLQLKALLSLERRSPMPILVDSEVPVVHKRKQVLGRQIPSPGSPPDFSPCSRDEYSIFTQGNRRSIPFDYKQFHSAVERARVQMSFEVRCASP
jgi:hypothetical protein